jgi:hypothetical protein
MDWEKIIYKTEEYESYETTRDSLMKVEKERSSKEGDVMGMGGGEN